jgi:hypothetical protein
LQRQLGSAAKAAKATSSVIQVKVGAGLAGRRWGMAGAYAVGSAMSRLAR